MVRVTAMIRIGLGMAQPDSRLNTGCGRCSFLLAERTRARRSPSYRSLQMSHTLSLAVFWSATVVGVAAQLLVIRSLLLGRTPGRSQTPAARAREAAWVLIPAAMFFAAVYFSWRRVERLPNNALQPHVATAEAAL